MLADEIDYNALDNTTAGRAIQAGFIFAALAVPDVVETRRGRIAAITGLAAANLVTIAAFNAFDEDPRNDLSEVLNRQEFAEGEDVAGPVQTWGVLAGLGAAGALALTAAETATDAAAKWLRGRGVNAPHTALGAGVAAIAFGAMELRARTR